MAMDKISGAEFQTAVIESETPVLVDFFATWCGPCRMLDPVLKELSEGFGDSVKFVKVDIDEAQQVAEKYAVMQVPTLMVFKGGEEAAKKVGAAAKPVIEGWIKASVS